jgi:hypothetical protein
VKTNKTRNTGNSRLKIEWRQTKQGTLAIVDSRYRVKTNKTRNTDNNRLSWVYYCQWSLFCLSSLCILSLVLPVFLVLFVFTLYLESIIASVPCFVCLHSVSWVYYCQWQTKQRTQAIVDTRYRVKTNKTRNTGKNRLKIQSEDKQNKEHWQ